MTLGLSRKVPARTQSVPAGRLGVCNTLSSRECSSGSQGHAHAYVMSLRGHLAAASGFHTLGSQEIVIAATSRKLRSGPRDRDLTRPPLGWHPGTNVWRRITSPCEGATRLRNRTVNETGTAMKRCAQCHGKLGLAVRSRNVWKGRWWVHLLYCSTHCEALHELERYNARARNVAITLAYLRRSRQR
jgi:hypothetical protein